MTKKFKAINMAKLDHPDRLKRLPPQRIMELIELEKGMSVADIGCGIGYFAIPMAKTVGNSGVVYALDLNPLMLEELDRRVQETELDNVKLIQSSENDFKMPQASVDVAFTATVHHELDDAVKFLKACNTILKPGGKMVVLDWHVIEEPMGPPKHKRVPKEKTIQDLEEAGFASMHAYMVGESFYIVVGEKKV